MKWNWKLSALFLACAVAACGTTPPEKAGVPGSGITRAAAEVPTTKTSPGVLTATDAAAISTDAEVAALAPTAATATTCTVALSGKDAVLTLVNGQLTAFSWNGKSNTVVANGDDAWFIGDEGHIRDVEINGSGISIVWDHDAINNPRTKTGTCAS